MKSTNKRRAIKATMERASNSNEGYYKYNITVKEPDGKVHTLPAYGRDMQDALSRLMNKQRTVKVENTVSANPWLALLAWTAICIWPAQMATETNNPAWLLIILAGLGCGVVGIWQWYKYINKE